VAEYGEEGVGGGAEEVVRVGLGWIMRVVSGRRRRCLVCNSVGDYFVNDIHGYLMCTLMEPNPRNV
jgi:hypothetical protein